MLYFININKNITVYYVYIFIHINTCMYVFTAQFFKVIRSNVLCSTSKNIEKLKILCKTNLKVMDGNTK